VPYVRVREEAPTVRAQARGGCVVARAQCACAREAVRACSVCAARACARRVCARGAAWCAVVCPEDAKRSERGTCRHGTNRPNQETKEKLIEEQPRIRNHGVKVAFASASCPSMGQAMNQPRSRLRQVWNGGGYGGIGMSAVWHPPARPPRRGTGEGVCLFEGRRGGGNAGRHW